MSHVLLESPKDLDLPDGPIAIDTEFHAEKRYVPRLHLIQVRGVEGPAQLIDPHLPGMLEGVSAALTSRTWILHAGRTDLQLLERALGQVPEEVLDTQIAAGLIAPTYPIGLARLTRELLGTQLDKSETLSDWAKRPLSASQLAYAADDVANLHALWAALEAAADAHSRTEVLYQASRTARDEAIGYEPPDDAWLSLPGRQSLSPERAVVLRELASWREETARELNQPPGSILGNRVLFDLAKRRPSTREGLVAGRRAPRSALNKHADVLLERIQRAAHRPEWAIPRTMPKGSRTEARMAWLRAWATIHGEAERWSARVVLPERALERIAHGDDVMEVLHPWQIELAGRRLAESMGASGGLKCPPIPA